MRVYIVKSIIIKIVLVMTKNKQESLRLNKKKHTQKKEKTGGIK